MEIDFYSLVRLIIYSIPVDMTLMSVFYIKQPVRTDFMDSTIGVHSKCVIRLAFSKDTLN